MEDAHANAKVAQPFLVGLLRRFVIAVLVRAFDKAHDFSVGAIISMSPPNAVGVDEDGGMDAAADLPVGSESEEGGGPAGAGAFRGAPQDHHMDIDPTSRAFLKQVSTVAITLAAPVQPNSEVVCQSRTLSYEPVPLLSCREPSGLPVLTNLQRCQSVLSLPSLAAASDCLSSPDRTPGRTAWPWISRCGPPVRT